MRLSTAFPATATMRQAGHLAGAARCATWPRAGHSGCLNVARSRQMAPVPQPRRRQHALRATLCFHFVLGVTLCLLSLLIFPNSCIVDPENTVPCPPRYACSTRQVMVYATFSISIACYVHECVTATLHILLPVPVVACPNTLFAVVPKLFLRTRPHERMLLQTSTPSEGACGDTGPAPGLWPPSARFN